MHAGKLLTEKQMLPEIAALFFAGRYPAYCVEILFLIHISSF